MIRLMHNMHNNVKLLRTYTIMNNKTFNTGNMFTNDKTKLSKKFIFGCFAGTIVGMGSAFGVYKYCYDPEKVLTTQIKKNFDEEYSYAAKMALFMRVPEPKLDIDDIINNKSDKNNEPLSISKWAFLVDKYTKDLEDGTLTKTTNYMRNWLLNYINDIPDIRMRFQGYRKIFNNSIELSILYEEQLQQILKKDKWIDADLLNEFVDVNKASVSYSNEFILLKIGLITYPKRHDQLFKYLNGDINVDQLMDNVNDNNIQIEQSLIIIKQKFNKLHPKVQEKLLEDVVIYLGKHTDFESIFENQLTEKFYDNQKLLSFVPQLVIIFKGLPKHIQAKMLITSIKQQNNHILNDEIRFLKKLLCDAGIVAIKLGQILAEDPAISPEYREILSDLRDDNQPSDILTFWSSILPSMRNDIKSLGICLGVGSVKQVHLIKLNNDGVKAIAVIKQGSEDDVVSTIKALSNIKAINGVLSRIKKMVFKELDLWMEYESFDQLKKSEYGKHHFISIPEVMNMSLNCLIREVADGKTLSNLAKTNQLDDHLLEKIKLLHEIAIKAAFEDGFIMSDLHLGNIIYDAENRKFVLFDPGQTEYINQYESSALLWTLVALTDDKRMEQYRDYVINELTNVAICDSQINKTDVLTACYEECKTITIPKRRFIYLISLAEKANIMLPSGFFACAKLLDSLTSQEKILAKIGTNITEKEIEKQFMKRLTIMNKLNLGYITYIKKLKE